MKNKGRELSLHTHLHADGKSPGASQGGHFKIWVVLMLLAANHNEDF